MLAITVRIRISTKHLLICFNQSAAYLQRFLAAVVPPAHSVKVLVCVLVEKKEARVWTAHAHAQIDLRVQLVWHIARKTRCGHVSVQTNHSLVSPVVLWDWSVKIDVGVGVQAAILNKYLSPYDISPVFNTLTLLLPNRRGIGAVMEANTQLAMYKIVPVGSLKVDVTVDIDTRDLGNAQRTKYAHIEAELHLLDNGGRVGTQVHIMSDPGHDFDVICDGANETRVAVEVVAREGGDGSG